MYDDSQSYCPFRVQTPDHQAGCTLLYGSTGCYTQNHQPLKKEKNHYTCPKTGIRITSEISHHLQNLLIPLFNVQDEYEISINVWPILKGIAHPKYIAKSLKGNDMTMLAQQLENEIQEIILNYY